MSTEEFNYVEAKKKKKAKENEEEMPSGWRNPGKGCCWC